MRAARNAKLDLRQETVLASAAIRDAAEGL